MCPSRGAIQFSSSLLRHRSDKVSLQVVVKPALEQQQSAGRDEFG